MTHAIYCPTCGWFGRKARRRNRNADAQGHMRWATQLAQQTRADRTPTPAQLDTWFRR